MIIPAGVIDFLSTLVQDELVRRQDRLLERRIAQAGFRDRGKTLDTFERLPHTAAEDLLEIVMRRYEKASTLI